MGAGPFLLWGIVVDSTTMTFFQKGLDKLTKIWYNGGSISGPGALARRSGKVVEWQSGKTSLSTSYTKKKLKFVHFANCILVLKVV